MRVREKTKETKGTKDNVKISAGIQCIIHNAQFIIKKMLILAKY